ncbi:YihA family ribosome biogenesis GTP-binding protein [Clostridium tyrobutyricum]|uniref:Probable GTP-binding protein EngB n=1 Tax=Clostridium tyrobutyricum DIVETGP TaxID=1408889 RepID=W6NBH8_CLOTY|nr:GTP-binding protein EngB [Clostridium tyrobutyricum]CDL92919.1 GTP-binding protein EngB [Clostridium tyrobutyricum DIVETGP]ANP70325.1 YihA family ribosome biogenesis GTP-binding protein [Clostridium tyrobutyricum]MBR9647984.1 YihA family ribosome biogenesis GTP-binding protein [Clostridium tyrobutyricum]MBV4416407.1 ribosome biogenesis GTP-binding protein YihA/YsxC [Clostridium tyrobutyricum]
MEIKQAEFIISAVKKNQYPNDNFKEIAFVGRSNVGKSSLINTIVNRRKLVKVSSSPGKTRLVNFFMINNEFYFVDLPGYGYAKVSKSEKDKWSKIIETYLVGRHQLKAIVLLVDSRHKPTNDDIMMYKWIEYYKYKILIVATKIDKISKNQLNKNLDIIRNSFGLKPDYKILTFSSLKKQGKEDLLNEIEHVVEGD